MRGRIDVAGVSLHLPTLVGVLGAVALCVFGIVALLADGASLRVIPILIGCCVVGGGIGLVFGRLITTRLGIEVGRDLEEQSIENDAGHKSRISDDT